MHMPNVNPFVHKLDQEFLSEKFAAVLKKNIGFTEVEQ